MLRGRTIAVNPSRPFRPLELLATVVAISLFNPQADPGTILQSLVSVPAQTDSKVASSVIGRSLTTSYPLSAWLRWRLRFRWRVAELSCHWVGFQGTRMVKLMLSQISALLGFLMSPVFRATSSPLQESLAQAPHRGHKLLFRNACREGLTHGYKTVTSDKASRKTWGQGSVVMGLGKTFPVFLGTKKVCVIGICVIQRRLMHLSLTVEEK